MSSVNALPDAKILADKRVAANTMRQACFRETFPLHRIAHIVGLRSEAKVVGSDASLVVARMQDLHPRWNRTVRQVVGDAMCDSWTASEPHEIPVSVDQRGSGPLPTTVAAMRDKRPKA